MNLAARRGIDFAFQAVAASAAMTASQRAEMSVTHREPSDVPVRAVERLTGQSIRGTTARTVVGHLAQASLAAAAIALARTTRRTTGASAVALIAGSLVASDAALAWMLGLAEAPWRWTPRDLMTDVTHKTSLAIAARTIVARSRPLLLGATTAAVPILLNASIFRIDAKACELGSLT